MIAMLRKIPGINFRSRTSVRTVLALIALLTVIACSNSKLILAPLYNRLDDQMRKEFNKLGDFDSSQSQEFEVRLQTFHLWHRRQELPAYAALIDDVSTTLASSAPKNANQIKQWMDRAEVFSAEARACHPVNFSFDLMRTLNDEQVNFIEARFAREQKKNQDRYNSRTAEERRTRRYDNILKWSGRIGLDFTQEQKDMLKETMERQISLREQYWALSSAWNKEFFVIARDQASREFRPRMATQLDKLWNLLEDNQTRQWTANRELWNGFMLDFANSMTTNQRKWADRWLGKLAVTLRDMSDDSSRFESGNPRAGDPNMGCQ